MSTKDLLGVPIVGPVLFAMAEVTLLAHKIERIKKASIGIGKIVPSAPDQASFFLEPGEMVVPRGNFNHIMYTINPDKKCYNARKHTTLKTLLKRYRK